MSEAPSDVNSSPELNAGVARVREPEITSAPLKGKGEEVSRWTDGWTDWQAEGWMSEAPSDVNSSPELNAGVVRLREPQITSAPLKCKGEEISRQMDRWIYGRTGRQRDGEVKWCTAGQVTDTCNLYLVPTEKVLFSTFILIITSKVNDKNAEKSFI